MKQIKPQSNRDLIERYSDQPSVLPREIRESIERRWNNQPVQLYAMSDLDANLNLAQIWVTLGPDRIAIIDGSNGLAVLIADLLISDIKSIRESHGLSCTVLTFTNEQNGAPLAVLRYSHRQRRAIENIRFVVEQRIDERDLTELKEADDVYASAAAKAANAHDFICKLPHGYDTIIGERGHTLSGGERQRVSIARAVLSNPRILILDEATSSVDTETERHIQEALERLTSGRTAFAVAHRLSTLRKATRLFVLDDGLIIEEGTHAELLNNPDGTYTKLHRMQQELHEAYAV